MSGYNLFCTNEKPKMDDEAPMNGENHRVELTEEELIKQAKEIQTLFDQLETEFAKPDTTFAYVLSKPWLDSWKLYVSYDAVTSGNPPDSHFGQKKPGKINEDIVVPNPQEDYVQFEGDDYRNVVLRDGLQPEVDYTLVTKEIWEKFETEYPSITVVRPIHTPPDGDKDVEVSLTQLNVIFVNNGLLQDIDFKRVSKFPEFKLQISAKNTILELKEKLVEMFSAPLKNKYLPKHPSYETVKPDQIRIWKLAKGLEVEKEFERIHEICRKSTSTEYKIPFEGDYIGQDESRIEELNLTAEDKIFIEVRITSHNWNFTNPAVPTMMKCDGCLKYLLLNCSCVCKKVEYCSEECRVKDLKYHITRCEKAEELNDSDKIIQTENSKLGLTGLENLGNTCFMNGALQCLSNFKELCQYFLLGLYKQELNETNPLGTKGKLAKQFALVLKNLWYGAASSFPPYTFKASIARFQPMFGGYQQHDSQEFLTFLLDGLHEDLNRVKNKPFVETLELKDQPDEVVAMRSWVNHLKRNQSVIVDLLHGQYKSQLTCPECNKVSTIFDPYMSVSVPIPLKKERDIDVFYLHADPVKKPFKFNLKFQKDDHHLSDLKRTIADYVEKDPSEFYFAFLTHSGAEIVTDEEGTLTNSARKKKKLKSLFAIELSPEDQAMPSGEFLDVEVSITRKPVYTGGMRKTLTFTRLVRLRKNYTLQDVYKKVFLLIRFLYNQFYPGKTCEDFETRNKEFLELPDEEAFKEIYENAENKPFKIMIGTNAKGLSECYFCGEKNCENCEMPYDATKTLDADVLSKIKDEDYVFKIELFYDNLPEFIDTDKFNACTDFFSTGKHKRDDTDKAEKMTSEEPGIAIQDCLNYFARPEQLGPDNEWYCSECKKHQRAFKRLEIYKAPPVLILHLKRFKVKPGMMSKTKIQEKVKFPVDDEYLDMGPYVKNHQLPMDYPELDEILHQPPKEESKSDSQSQSEKENGMDIEEPTKPVGQPAAEGQKMDHIEASGTGDQQQLPYQLFGVINHFGNLGFGHYTAYAKNWNDNRWYRFDDSHVTPADPEEVCSPASYVLFYRRVGLDFKLPPLELPKMPEKSTTETAIALPGSGDNDGKADDDDGKTDDGKTGDGKIDDDGKNLEY